MCQNEAISGTQKPSVSIRLWPTGLMIVGGVAAFGAFAADLLCKGLIYRWGDSNRYYFHEHATQGGVLVCSGISALGEFAFLLPYGVVVGAFLFYRRERYATVLWSIALLGSAVLNEILKHLFKIPRPEQYTFYAFPAASEAGYSFPSGHTMGVAIVAGATVIFASHLGLVSRNQFRLAAAGAIFVSLLVAFSLLYIGVHTLIDVLAALAVSTAWLGVIRLLLLRRLIYVAFSTTDRCANL